MTIQQTEKRPRSNQIRNFTLDQNDTAVLMFPFVAYDKAANISLIINEGDSPTSVEVTVYNRMFNKKALKELSE